MSYRGRSNTNNFNSNRGRSNSRRPWLRGNNRRRFDSSETRQEEVNKKNEKAEQIEEVKNTPVPKVDNEKKENLIEKGKNWFNNFFGGMKRKDRSNIRIEFNQDIDLELIAMYDNKLNSRGTVLNYFDTRDLGDLPDNFRAMTSLLIALKLIVANSDSNKADLDYFTALTKVELRVPKALGLLINHIGKTDIGHDNVARIIGHNSIVKQQLFKTCMLHAALQKDNYNNMSFTGTHSFEDIKTFVKNHFRKGSTINFYTKDASGTDLIHEFGKRAIDKVNEYNIPIIFNNKEVCKARVPYLNPNKLGKIDEIIKWEQETRTFFTGLKQDLGSHATMLGLALIGWLPQRFIINKSKTLGVLDPDLFQGGVYENVTVDSILKADNWYDINEWMSDKELYDNTINFMNNYKQTTVEILDSMFNLEKFNATEYGSPAQIVTDHGQGNFYFVSDKYENKIKVVDNVKPTQSLVKLTDEEAVIGSSFKFNNSVTIENNYRIYTVGNSKEARIAYIGKDFKKV